MLSRATYCTREDVLSVLQVLQTPRAYPQVDRAIESATDNIDRRCHRTFHPTTATRYFPWPDANSSAVSWRFWLDDNELGGALTTLTSGGTTITSYFLEPQAAGPPYNRIEINTASTAAFSTGSTHQRAIVVTGPFGYSTATQAATALAGALASTSATTLAVADGSQVGVGDLLVIDSERLIVTGRSALTSAQTLQTPMTASAANTSCAVTTGTAFHIGEVITLDTEQMLITEITGNTLTVERAVNSSVLATHAGSTIYAPRTLTVVRGANGTTAATHLDAAPVLRSWVPAPVRSLAIAESIVELQQGGAGYARTAGSGENERVIGAGAGLSDLRDQVETGFRRKVRIRVV